LSKAYSENHHILDYTIALNDSHNFWLPLEKYKNLFNANFLAYKLPLENFDINNVMLEKTQLRFMNFASRLSARERTETWKEKYYPKTREEYLKIFDAYLELCKKNNVRPIICTFPVSECYKKYFSKKIIAEFNHDIDEALKKYPAVFLDAWNIQSFDDSDFYDVDHLNIKGAAKFSTILNGVIEQIENS